MPIRTPLPSVAGVLPGVVGPGQRSGVGVGQVLRHDPRDLDHVAALGHCLDAVLVGADRDARHRVADREQLGRAGVLALRRGQHCVALTGHGRTTCLDLVLVRRRSRTGGARSAEPVPESWTKTVCAPRAVRSRPCTLLSAAWSMFLVETGACCAGAGSAADAVELVLTVAAATVVMTSTARPTRPMRDGDTRDSFASGKGTAGKTAEKDAAQPEMCGGSQQPRHHSPESPRNGRTRAVGI